MAVTHTKQRRAHYNISVTITSTYYDTAIGYYTLQNTYTGTIDVPDEDETYIYVYYQ